MSNLQGHIQRGGGQGGDYGYGFVAIKKIPADFKVMTLSMTDEKKTKPLVPHFTI